MNGDDKKEDGTVSGVVKFEGSGAGLPAHIPVGGMVAPDLERYRAHVEHFDLTGDQKTDLLLAVWQIMRSFVDRAFGDDPVQQVRPRTISLPRGGESRDDGEALSGTFRHCAAGKKER